MHTIIYTNELNNHRTLINKHQHSLEFFRDVAIYNHSTPQPSVLVCSDYKSAKSLKLVINLIYNKHVWGTGGVAGERYNLLFLVIQYSYDTVVIMSLIPFLLKPANIFASS